MGENMLTQSLKGPGALSINVQALEPKNLGSATLQIEIYAILQ